MPAWDCLTKVWQITLVRSANKFRSRVCTTVIHHNDFESGGVGLVAQGFQTLNERTPIIVDGDDNADSGAMDEVNDREPSLLVCDSQPNTLLTVGLHTQQENPIPFA